MDINENAPGNMSQKGHAGGTDNETCQNSKGKEPVQPADKDAPHEEDMSDVDAADSVASEHPDN